MREFDYVTYEARVTTLSPMHIGTGRELLLDYDYAVQDGQTWRLNEDEVLQLHFSDDPAQIARLSQTAPAKLLSPDAFRAGSKFFRYTVKGQPRARQAGSILREQIKTVNDQPYLPGSSLKGALRTVLAWHAWDALGLRPDPGRLDKPAEFAARNYERMIFGSDPNHDLLRALQVGDSIPVGPERLILANVKVLMAREEGSPIEVEAVKPDTTFVLPMKIDTCLFSDWARRREGFRLGGAREWLENLVTLARAHAQERIKLQRAWYEARPNGARPAGFYRVLEQLALGKGQFVIQLGWGGGWDSKTFGTRLTSEGDFLEWLVTEEYRMAKGRRRRGDPFPRSRRAAMSVTRSAEGETVERPAAPLGWVLVELTPTGAPPAGLKELSQRAAPVVHASPVRAPGTPKMPAKPPAEIPTPFAKPKSPPPPPSKPKVTPPPPKPNPFADEVMKRLAERAKEADDKKKSKKQN